MKKALRAFPVRLLSRPPLYGSRRSSTITQGRNGFTPPRQYCGGGATGVELRMRGRYIGRAATGVERRNNNNGDTEMPSVIWDHVHLRSPDPEATAAWLQDVLGGEIIRGPGRIDVKLGGANVFIAPVAAGDGVNIPPVTPYQGLDHFGLTVKDIDAVAAEIKAKGVEFTKEPTTIRPGVRICFIRGPQGISIELLERDKKYA
jgi:lactoylglutathione lyase